MKTDCIAASCATLLMLCIAGISPVQAQPEMIEVVQHAENIQAVNIKDGKVLFKNSDPERVIEWAMKHSPVTVLRQGRYTAYNPIDIPRDNVTFIIDQGAHLTYEADPKTAFVATEEHGNYYPFIYNHKHNNVRIIHLGTIAVPPAVKTGQWVAMMFDGRDDGKIGIIGGMLFSAGKFENTTECAWIVDSKDVEVPLFWSDHCPSAVLAAEGCEDLRIGAVLNLEFNGCEAIDLNGWNDRYHIDFVLSTSGSEAIDLNSSPNGVVEHVIGFPGCRKLAKNLPYPIGSRRLTNRERFDILLYPVAIVKKQQRLPMPKSWDMKVTSSDITATSTEIKVSAVLTGEFQEGNKEVFRKDYVIDLWTAGVPDGMALIPAGDFVMGDTFGEGSHLELPLHTNTQSAFYMDKYEVSKQKWDKVYNWAIDNGYKFKKAFGKAPNHPVHSVRWVDCVLWANALSEMEGLTPCYINKDGTVSRSRNPARTNWSANGYRLPTEAQWEKAARGGTPQTRFPWSGANTIRHTRANYYANPDSYAYDTSAQEGYHPDYAKGGFPYTSPIGSFEPNGYGLYDMAGNVREWCWDKAIGKPYLWGDRASAHRIIRGGEWGFEGAYACRISSRDWSVLDTWNSGLGFRLVKAAK